MGESDFECILWDLVVLQALLFYSIDITLAHLGVNPTAY